VWEINHIYKVIPNHNTGIFAVVPDNNSENSIYNRNSILIIDEVRKNVSKQIIKIIKLEFEVINIFFTAQKWLIVHHEKGIFGYDL